MPNIPQYISKEKVTTEVGGAMQNPNVAAEYGAGAKIQQAGNVLAELGDKMRKIGNANAESDATIAIKQFQATDSQKRAQEPDMNKALQNIESDVQKNRDAIANQYFSDPIGKQEWLRKQELNDAAYVIDRKADVYKRQVSERKVKTLKDLKLEKSNYINAVDETSKQASIKSMETIVNNPANTDIYNAEERKKLVDETIKEAQTDVKDRESLGRVKEKELRIASELAVNTREKELVNMKVKGTDQNGVLITREDLLRLARDESGKTISPEFANSFINANKSPKSVDAKTVDKDFADTMYDINKGVKKPEKIRKEMLQLVSDGYLSERDFSNASTYLNMLGDKKPDDLAAQNVRKSWRGIEIFTENTTNAEESRSRMSRSFVSKLQQGIEPSIASTEAIREEVLFLQPNAKNYPQGMKVIDAHGVKKIIMPNGDVLPEEVKLKTPTKGK